MSALHCIYEKGGVFLPALRLWLDASKAQRGSERVFVSHAHSDHIAAHREVILTDPTARLMRSRLPGKRQEHRLKWRSPQTFSDGPVPWTISLLPAGHILGSAMALIQAGGESLLYTGDFKLRAGPASEACETTRADILIMETTFGRPEYVFPPTDSVLAEIIRFCRETLQRNETPVLLGYSLGKTQEILAGLAGTGLPIAIHPVAAKLTRIYERCGITFPPHSILDRKAAPRGHVILVPPGTQLDKAAPDLGPVRKAVLTGWALKSSCRFRHQADAAFPLSDHADFPDLLRFAHLVQPREILTLHGFAADFAQSLRDAGFQARSLSENDQLHLPLGILPRHNPSTSSGTSSPGA